ncbi:MAG: OmpH family outer membrane protein [Aliidiomarina sp.]|uniref:OmpH family outer membrane protein n=1 Tax=Aliidiomarina sp. TaxID=1872439 RepID=UPI0025B98DE9|nr:OmpH family outer membrane protein [Aliidiomarina sp.]MCH8500460.1 OmpH family outer membrane protein [Aliidiomarina sp.]
MRAVAISFAAVIALAASVFSVSAEANSPKIAVIDVQRVFQAMPEREDVSQRLEAEFAEPIQELEQLEAQFEELRERFQRDEAIMSDDEKMQAQEELRQRAMILQRGGEQLNQYMQQRENEERNQLLQKMFEVVDAYAAAEGIDLIMDKGRMLYASDALDISDAIITRLTR